MSGMTTTGAIANSDYNSRTVAIEVTGVRRQDVMKTSNYTVKVPYSRMSQTLQNIARMGGKVANVTMLSSSSTTQIESEAKSEAATQNTEARSQQQEQTPAKRGRGRRGRKK